MKKDWEKIVDVGEIILKERSGKKTIELYKKDSRVWIVLNDYVGTYTERGAISFETSKILPRIIDKNTEISVHGTARSLSYLGLLLSDCKSVDLSDVELTDYKTANNVFRSSNIGSVTISNLDFDKITDTWQMFIGTKINKCHIKGINFEGKKLSQMFENVDINELILEDITANSINCLLYNCNIKKLILKNVTINSSFMPFYGSNIDFADCSGLYIKKDASSIFCGVKINELKSCIINSNCTNLSQAFYNCKINSVDLSDWAVDGVQNFDRMFFKAKIQRLNLRHWAVNIDDLGNVFEKADVHEILK